MKDISEYKNIEEYLKEKEKIKKGMHDLVAETAEELGYDHVSLPGYGGDYTSRTIGLHTGPVGGVVVQKLISSGMQQLIEQYNRDHNINK